MAFWRDSIFLMNFRKHIVKWYQTVLLPVFHIDNSGSVQKFHNEGENPQTKVEMERAAQRKREEEKSVTMPGMNQEIPDASEDALEVLNRINNDRHGKHMDEVEKARRDADEAKRKADEEARLASIMNANKVDVDSFIAQGKSAAQEAKEAEEMRRAREIIDRLNNEAAADEAAKQAEIEEAKRQAAQSGASGDVGAGDDEKAAEEMRRAQEIFERLQREAAEDEAAKQAELDAAMAEAAEKFGG